MYNQISSNKRKSLILVMSFIALTLLLGWLINRLYPELGYAPLAAALLISFLMTIISYYKGDKIALTTAGAQGPLQAEENPYVYRLVENLCITAGLPMPKIYIIPDSGMNAFATGRDPQHASIALTQGIIDGLENEELEGVIAHELSHIKNYDIRLMTMVIVLVGIVMLLADWIIRIQWYGRRKNSGNSDSQLGLIFLVLGIMLAILSPLIAQLIKLAISRKREFLADASGALLTRYPEGLASALEKISQQQTPLKHASQAMAHLYIANPFGAQARRGLKKLFATHPPIEERIKVLREMDN